jgi:hypothetical protein
MRKRPAATLPGGVFVPLDRTLLDLAMATSRETPWRGAAEGDAFAAKVLQPGLAYALLHGGRLLGCGGIAPEWHGRALVWMIVTKLARPREIMVAVRVARRFLEIMQRGEPAALRRLELVVNASRPWCHSFPKALGFVLEGRCAAFGPDGADYLQFSRVVQETYGHG